LWYLRFFRRSPKAVAWLTASLISQLGNRFYMVAVPWLVMAMTGSVLWTVVVWSIENLPYLVVGPLLGAIIDRRPSWKSVFIWCEVGQAASLAAIPVLAALGWLSAAAVGASVFAANSFGTGSFLLADYAVLPSLVETEDLGVANSLSGVGSNLALIAGPALGGLLVARVGPAATIGIDAATFLVTGLVVALVVTDRPAPAVAEAKGAGFVRETREALRFLRRQPTSLGSSCSSRWGTSLPPPSSPPSPSTWATVGG
jgi:MFS family permease